MTTRKTAAEIRQILASRKLERVVVLGANGTMGYGSAALFTTAVPEVILLARTKAKAEPLGRHGAKVVDKLPAAAGVNTHDNPAGKQSAGL